MDDCFQPKTQAHVATSPLTGALFALIRQFQCLPENVMFTLLSMCHKKRLMRMLASERKPACLAKETLWIGRPQRSKCGGIIPPSLLWDRQKNDSELGRHVAAK